MSFRVDAKYSVFPNYTMYDVSVKDEMATPR